MKDMIHKAWGGNMTSWCDRRPVAPGTSAYSLTNIMVGRAMEDVKNKGTWGPVQWWHEQRSGGWEHKRQEQDWPVEVEWITAVLTRYELVLLENKEGELAVWHSEGIKWQYYVTEEKS